MVEEKKKRNINASQRIKNATIETTSIELNFSFRGELGEQQEEEKREKIGIISVEILLFRFIFKHQHQKENNNETRTIKSRKSEENKYVSNLKICISFFII